MPWKTQLTRFSYKFSEEDCMFFTKKLLKGLIDLTEYIFETYEELIGLGEARNITLEGSIFRRKNHKMSIEVSYSALKKKKEVCERKS